MKYTFCPCLRRNTPFRELTLLVTTTTENQLYFIFVFFLLFFQNTHIDTKHRKKKKVKWKQKKTRRKTFWCTFSESGSSNDGGSIGEDHSLRCVCVCVCEGAHLSHQISRTEPRIVYFKSYYVELQEQRLQSLRKRK